MQENEKTAPISSVGADEGQSIPSNSIIPQSKSEIKWLSDEMKINEPLFCESFCQSRELKCIDGISRWREAECKVLTEICNRHGIQIAAPEKSRGSLTVEQYKEYAKITEQVEEKKEEVARLDEQAESADRLRKHREELRIHIDEAIDKLDERFQEKNAAVAHLDEEIAEKSSVLTQTAAELADNQTLLEMSAKKVTKLKSIDEIETGKTMKNGGDENG